MGARGADATVGVRATEPPVAPRWRRAAGSRGASSEGEGPDYGAAGSFAFVEPSWQFLQSPFAMCSFATL